MLVALVSLKGSPGVTRLAMALAAVWPDGTPALLMECDPAGGTLGAQYGLPASPSLMSLAAASFQKPDVEVLAAHRQELPGSLPVVIAPADAAKTAAAVAEITAPGALLSAVRSSPSLVVVSDCGRLDVTSPMPVVEMADVVVVVARPIPEDVVLLPPAVDTLRKAGNRLVLVLRGSGHAVRNVARVLDVPVLTVPDIGGRRLFSRAPDLAYARAALELAHELSRLVPSDEPMPAVVAP